MIFQTIAFIFARGGSKGLKDKNILQIRDKPLIAHSIDLAKKIKEIDKIFVSTDSDKIANIGEKYGAQIIERPKELAMDNSPEWLSWQHAINFFNNKYGPFKKFLSLPPTAPLRSINDIQKCLDALKGKVDIVTTMTESHRNPWFNMVTYSEKNNDISLINKNDLIKRRQDAPKCFDLSTVAYVANPDFVIKKRSIWDGFVRGIEIPIERSIDIDNKYDFEIAKFLFSKKI